MRHTGVCVCVYVYVCVCDNVLCDRAVCDNVVHVRDSCVCVCDRHRAGCSLVVFDRIIL